LRHALLSEVALALVAGLTAEPAHAQETSAPALAPAARAALKATGIAGDRSGATVRQILGHTAGLPLSSYGQLTRVVSRQVTGTGP
jgi:hypothetical protein